MEEKTKKFLELLEAKGITEEENISGQLSSIFPWDEKDLKNTELVEETKKIRQFIAGLRAEGLIKLKDEVYTDLGKVKPESGEYWWLNTRPISGRITVKGIETLDKEREKENDTTLRNSVINTNKITIINICVTLFVTGLIFAFQIETNSRERRREKREILQDQQNTQELMNRSEWAKQLNTSFRQLNQALLEFDTSIKKVKIVSGKR